MDLKTETDQIIFSTLLQFFPDAQAIYLFGSFGTPFQRDDSDVDVGILLAPRQAKDSEKLLGQAKEALVEVLSRSVHLINLRAVNIVLQNEVVTEGRHLLSRDEFETDMYEMHVLSLFLKYHEETAEIVREIMASGRVLA